MDLTKILIEGSVFAVLAAVMMFVVGRITEKRDSATDEHLKVALAQSQTNFQETLKIAVANTAALTKQTETLEQLTEAVQKTAEISRASAETVRDLVKLLQKG